MKPRLRRVDGRIEAFLARTNSHKKAIRLDAPSGRLNELRSAAFDEYVMLNKDRADTQILRLYRGFKHGLRRGGGAK